MERNIYRKLQQHLDVMPVPFPRTESGVELKLLQELFDEEEAAITLNLSALPEPLDKIHKRFRKDTISKTDLKDKLDGMYRKGTIMAVRRPKVGFHYSKLPLAIGMFEFQVNRITRDVAENFYRYEDEAFAEPWLKAKVKQMRTIPVNTEVYPEFFVGQYDNARKLIEESPGPFAVMNCVCRQAKDTMDQPCQQTNIRETCITIGKAAKHMKSKGLARYLSKKETIDLLIQAEKVGMVLQPENTREPKFICCCCGCCCGVLTAARKFEKPAEFMETNYEAQIDPAECSGCEACMAICQMDALFSTDSHTKVNSDRCIGCGVCISACSTGALKLVSKKKKAIPLKDSSEMYKKMMMERYGVIGTLKLLGKALLGQKI